MTASENAHRLLTVAAVAADAKQGEDLVALDVSGPLPLTDVFLLVSGKNERNVQAIASEVEEKLIAVGAKPLRREGRAEGRWILLDFGDLVVHVFHEEDRMYYSLERLWKDCPAIPLNLPVAPAVD
ncbi:ribosome-associated protein [Microbacteriaceae bacterium SG_E_30_P1]|uniref:Ribosomal silencing factor RsfS n=1 Tax=Antiquaquibacter oligotrophicus TaxID=2880260 RepID=A0ABT6KPU7_9MICO|nr:ribosome silencing factor [Antiquaquibacter oligotrophicus]MDH6181209.1 ribosome-associated protein [Antiquaquibacter oligotrophicus]UDF13096.1 ribosome silencing factor [Antiquaquibacter oligotrophicus]